MFVAMFMKEFMKGFVKMVMKKCGEGLGNVAMRCKRCLRGWCGGDLLGC